MKETERNTPRWQDRGGDQGRAAGCRHAGLGMLDGASQELLERMSVSSPFGPCSAGAPTG
jgi:hypothetical protein